MKTSTANLLGILLFAGLFTREAGANAIFQLDARKHVAVVESGTETNLVWQTLQGMAVSGDASEWQDTGDGVKNIAPDPALVRPLAFKDDTTTNGQYVRSIVMVVRCTQEDGFRVKETLVGGDRNFCLAGLPENLASNNVHAVFEENEIFAQAASWRVDGVEFAGLEKGKTLLVEVVFEQSMRLPDIVLCGQKGRREWRYGWGGQLCEAIGLSSELTPDERAGLYHVLRLKWKLSPDIPSASQAQHSAARSLGINLGSYVSTLFLIK